MTAADPRQQALIASLRSRFAEALRSGDAEAKKALFKEAVYLGIQPDLFSDIGSDLDPGAPYRGAGPISWLRSARPPSAPGRGPVAGECAARGGGVVRD